MTSPLPHLAATLIAAASVTTARCEDLVWLGRFDSTQASLPAPWGLIRLDTRVTSTEYRLRNWDGAHAIEAVANDSMALLARPVSVNLTMTPMLCWRWRIDSVVESADMRRKGGDDYAARLYVTFSLPPDSMHWTTRIALRAARSRYGDAVPDAALNYVWDNKYPIGTTLPNAYTDRTQMIVVQSGNANAGRWVWQQRDVAQDFVEQFGNVGGTIASLAIAADTDNTDSHARAGFADLHFVSRDRQCDRL